MTDLQKIRELQGKVMKDIAAGALIPIMMIGDELNLFEKLYTVISLSLKLITVISLSLKLITAHTACVGEGESEQGSREVVESGWEYPVVTTSRASQLRVTTCNYSTCDY